MFQNMFTCLVYSSLVSGADSLYYLSVEGLVKAVQQGITEKTSEMGHCTACLTGEYPGGIQKQVDW